MRVRIQGIISLADFMAVKHVMVFPACFDSRVRIQETVIPHCILYTPWGLNPSNAKTNFVLRTRTQQFLKTI